MKNRILYIMLCFLGIAVTACQKDFMKDGDPAFDRTFMPTSLKLTSVDNSPVTKVEFRMIPGIQKYFIQFGTDSVDFAGKLVYQDTIDVTSMAPTDNTVSATFKVLAGETKYFVRVKSVSVKQGTEDSKWNQASITTPKENLFFKFLSQNGVTGVGEVSLVWDGGNLVDDVQFIPADNSAATIAPISASEVSAGKKVVTGLKTNMDYTINLRMKGAIRGTQTLRVEGDIFVKTGDDLESALKNATADQIIVLANGSNFSVPNVALGAGVTVRGAAGATQPVLAIGTVTLPSSATNVIFENLALSPAGSGQYIINQSAACSIGSLVFKDCKISDFSNTPIRLQGSAAVAIGTIRITNCVVTNTASGSYALIHASGAGPSIQNISVTNSTVYGLKGAFMRIEGSNSNRLKTVVVDGVTLSGFAGYTFRFSGTQCNDAVVTLKNSIIANANGVVGIQRPAASGNPTFKLETPDNVYKTADYVETPLNGASGPIDGLTGYTGSASDLFVDPANGNFNIKDAAFSGKTNAGDPRWRQQ